MFQIKGIWFGLTLIPKLDMNKQDADRL